LNWDPFTDVVLLLLNSPVFLNFLGSLDANGQASAQINAPSLPTGYVGTVMHYAFCCNGPFDFASNSVGIKIVP
jgi:hypothetical protein